MEAYGKRVIARLKEHGLDVAEELIQQVADAVFEEAKVEVLGNDKVWDDILAPALDIAQSSVNKMIDKIDGQVG